MVMMMMMMMMIMMMMVINRHRLAARPLLSRRWSQPPQVSCTASCGTHTSSTCHTRDHPHVTRHPHGTKKSYARTPAGDQRNNLIKACSAGSLRELVPRARSAHVPRAKRKNWDKTRHPRDKKRYTRERSTDQFFNRSYVPRGCVPRRPSTELFLDKVFIR